jgi:hypothetical protein
MSFIIDKSWCNAFADYGGYDSLPVCAACNRLERDKLRKLYGQSSIAS